MSPFLDVLKMLMPSFSLHKAMLQNSLPLESFSLIYDQTSTSLQLLGTIIIVVTDHFYLTHPFTWFFVQILPNITEIK